MIATPSPRTAGLAAAVADPGVVARYRAKLLTAPGSDCLWWTGAISGRGHGRFWVSGSLVVIAHRFGYALTHGAAALTDAPVLGHRCDNPLCQRIGEGHVVASTATANRREWAARRHILGTPLTDPRGARRRARALRDLARTDPALLATDLATTPPLCQLELW